MDDVSYITILKPREPNYKTSSRITTDFIVELESFLDRNNWTNRREFFFQTLAFCLSLPNLWRFPKEALTQGQAAFVWLYIIFMVIIGSALLFFEVALGQYSSKGFAKVFSMCPLFEGISYAMAFYCATVSTYYNMLNAYSFIYLFASFNHTLEYASCNSFPKEMCVKGTTNQTLSPEHVYFYHRIVYYSSDSYNQAITFYPPNWRNVGVLFFLWVLVCIVILRGIRTAKWPAMVFCPIPYTVLILTLISALTLKGSGMGLKAMFLLNYKDLLKPYVWRRALEQTIIALGLGMGPLITLGSYSKFQSPADKDCLILCIFTLIGSLLSGGVLFSSAGVLAHERNETMTTVLKQEGRYPSDLSVHVVFSQLFARLSPGLSHIVSFVFFLTFLLAGWYSLITYTETFIVSCYSLFPASYKHKLYTNLGLCICCYVVGTSMASRAGYTVMMALDRFLVAIGLVIIILCELCAVVYIYGVQEFCDDVDFTLGFYPSIYWQTIWLFSPVIFLFQICEFLYARFTQKLTIFGKHTLIITGTIIILPIVLKGLYNAYISFQMGDIRQVVAAREIVLTDDDDFAMSHTPSTHGDKGSTKWFRRYSDHKLVGLNDTAGPSRNVK